MGAASIAVVAFAMEVCAATTVEPLGHFFRDINSSDSVQSLHRQSQWMGGSQLVHYRLLPGRFPKGMGYHFDGLATVMALRFDSGRLRATVRPFHSELYDAYDSCIFFGSGTGPTDGKIPCLTNPLVNLLPIQGQLWLTIDTVMWGRIDPTTLGTVRGAGVRSLHGGVLPPTLTLNAHPACDRVTGQCFVEHPCPIAVDDDPVSNEACISELLPDSGGVNLHLANLTRATLPAQRLIQHSHSPCITPNFVVAKLDSFAPRLDSDKNDAGLLRLLHQKQDDLWMVMDRRTNRSEVVQGSHLSFVNNHFWNCYEDDVSGSGTVIVVETVAATSAYLDTYFRDRLGQPSVSWDKIFLPPQRCLIHVGGDSHVTNVTCTPLLGDRSVLFDYPTFNPVFHNDSQQRRLSRTRAFFPYVSCCSTVCTHRCVCMQLVKMDSKRYRHFFAISPNDRSSRWFDRLIKVDRTEGSVVATFSAPDIFLTEADFIPRKPVLTQGQGDDDGWLITVGFNASSDESSVWMLDAKTLGVVDKYDLGCVVPFHAHGVSCLFGECFTNP